MICPCSTEIASAEGSWPSSPERPEWGERESCEARHADVVEIGKSDCRRSVRSQSQLGQGYLSLSFSLSLSLSLSQASSSYRERHGKCKDRETRRERERADCLSTDQARIPLASLEL